MPAKDERTFDEVKAAEANPPDIDVDDEPTTPTTATVILERRVSYAVQGPGGSTATLNLYGFAKDGDANEFRNVDRVWKRLGETYLETFERRSASFEWAESHDSRWD